MTRHLIHAGHPQAGSAFPQRPLERHPEPRRAGNGAVRSSPGDLPGGIVRLCRGKAARLRAQPPRAARCPWDA
jgi:hypothetical protein